MKVTQLELVGLRLIEPVVHADARGFLLESWSRDRYRAAGIDCNFVQGNHSRSVRGTLRGLHHQARPGQAKLVRVATGRIFDVAVDIRPDSPTFGKWVGVHLDDVRHQQLFVPVGFAHGFCVLSEVADVIYELSAPYDAEAERTLAWNDPDLAIVWPIADPVLSARDAHGEAFSVYRSLARS